MLCQWVAGRPALMPMVVIYGPVSGAGRFMDEGVFFPACGSAQLRGSMHASSYPLMAHFMSITHLEGLGLWFMKTLCFIQLQLAAVFLIVKGLTFHME